MLNKISPKQAQLLILVFSVLFFVPYLGVVHLFDWDEINFAESAREMIASGDYLNVQINYTAFWEKPPLFIWMQVLSMKIFGINEYAARFPNAICGIFTLLTLYRIGSKELNHKFGLLWVIAYAGSILPFFYFKSGIIDPWFNYFIFLSIYYFYKYFESEDYKVKNVILAGFFNGLGILTKGPVAFLVFLLVFGVYLLIKKFKIRTTFLQVLYFTLAIAFTGGFWFLLQILNGNYTVIQDFIEYQIRLFTIEDAGHGGFLLYHFVILLIGVFPASIFALPAIFGTKHDNKSFAHLRLWMVILFWTVLILFTIVNTKIVHYSSLCYFPLTFIGATMLYKWIVNQSKPGKLIQFLIALVGSVYVLLVAGIIYFAMHKTKFVESIQDKFARANLEANISWTGFEFLVAISLLIGLILFFVFIKKDKLEKAIVFLGASCAIFLVTIMPFVVPKIEGYSQRAALEFFEEKSKEDAYLTTIHYKSYAQYFYGKIQPYENRLATDRSWLLYGNVDKPVYIATKNIHKNKVLQNNKDYKLLYEKNGFVFFVRPLQK